MGDGPSPGAGSVTRSSVGSTAWAHAWDVRVAVGAFTASRLVALLGAFIAGLVPPGTPLVRSLTMWDGRWYLEVVARGYPAGLAQDPDGTVGQSPHAFFPLFPLLIRVVRRVVPVSDEVAAVGVAVAFGVAATVLLWLLARDLFDRDVADRAAILFCFFPGSFVLSTAYAEPVLLTFAIASTWALLRRRWVLAGLAAAAATAARPNAVAVIAACAWAAAAAVVHRREWRALVAPALAPLGVVGFHAFLWRRTGDATAWFDVQREGWDEGVDLGQRSWQIVTEFADTPFRYHGVTIAVVGLVVIVAAVAVLARVRLPGPLNVYSGVVLALTVLTRTLTARPRFVLTAFPIFIAVAARVRGHAFTLLVALCTAGLLYVVVMYSWPTPIAGAP